MPALHDRRGEGHRRCVPGTALKQAHAATCRQLVRLLVATWASPVNAVHGGSQRRAVASPHAGRHVHCERSTDVLKKGRGQTEQ